MNIITHMGDLKDIDMTDKPKGKPSSRFFAKAMPLGDGFAAQYSAPGLIPDYVLEGKRKAIFDTEFEAELAANRTLVNVLQSRIDKPEIRSGYEPSTANDLSHSLDTAGISPQFFSWLTGARPHTVMGWLDGTRSIPHQVHLLAKLCESPDILNKMEEITEECAFEKTRKSRNQKD